MNISKAVHNISEEDVNVYIDETSAITIRIFQSDVRILEIFKTLRFQIRIFDVISAYLGFFSGFVTTSAIYLHSLLLYVLFPNTSSLLLVELMLILLLFSRKYA